ncbi:MAG: hypothetical protein OEW86_11725 [Nitrosopumilus sp.]|nr:hypothetical protein [Nitrosopumilus sp.]MDH3565219.1 hypothetical protein [Nitrosopumilus sp.]MDH5418632.1 hypothetical protein [Nitrosopumilus sp.]MDH5555648.1 hypothetical protein [Nitrosopumilus sp.]
MIKKNKDTLGIKDKCVICSEKVQLHFRAMDEWGIEGTLCGKCYSKKLDEYYPGEHIRVNKHLD